MFNDLPLSDTVFATVKDFKKEGFKVTAVPLGVLLAGKPHRHTAKGEANETKLENNLTRAKAKIFELAACNPWTWFATFTLDPAKYDRGNLRKYSKDLGQFLRDYRKRTGRDVKYLLVPEQHKDGAWHMHGFLEGIPETDLHRFTETEPLPLRLLSRVRAGKKVYTWKPYAARFGYSSLERIENPEASSRYITKYATKDALRSVKQLNAHIYYASQKLATAQLVACDTMCRPMDKPAYSREFCAVTWTKDKKDALSYVYPWEAKENDPQ